MLKFLFRRLTDPRPDGEPLFTALTVEARRPHWFVEGAVPDTLDGRFAMLATLTALALVRLESLGERGNSQSVALTERFITVMESEHRELGLGDPTLGKKVRRLVGSLAKRVALWRNSVEQGDWLEATRQSVYKAEPMDGGLDHSSAQLRALWQRLQQASLDMLAQGRFN
jgi:cytochrome b pre-mRNA-processing protein 3